MQQTDITKAIARARRKAPPLAERRLWEALRNRRFLGAKVRREVPLAGRVFAFYLPDQRLAIDLGSTGGSFVPVPADPLLSDRGFRVLQLDRRAVMADLPASLACIARAFGPRIDPPNIDHGGPI